MFRSSTVTVFQWDSVTTWSMARRLPQLVRRALRLAWRVNPAPWSSSSPARRSRPLWKRSRSWPPRAPSRP
ncbi:hypothetical protein O1L60_38605 [Streptomyces diastatochromogenes]|nr:hypothetical protein [Streptomyces diastatochromogenes]